MENKFYADLAGTSTLQRSKAYGQRVWKWQPGGGSAGLIIAAAGTWLLLDVMGFVRVDLRDAWPLVQATWQTELAVILCLLPVPSVVRVVASVLVLGALASFVPLLLLAEMRHAFLLGL